jgi:tyrosine-protein kinase Etk/Wzc
MDNMTSLNGNQFGQAGNTGGSAIHDYLAIIFRGRYIILTTFVAVMLLVSYYTFTTPPTYESSTTVIVDEKGQGIGQSIFDVGGISKQRTLINNQVEILKSRSLAVAVVERLQRSTMRDSLPFIREIGKTLSFTDAAGIVQGSISIAPLRETDLVEIHVHGATPFTAAFLANTVAKAYQELDRDLSRGEISQIVQFLDEQLDRKEGDLKQSEEKLKTFLEQEKIASLSEEATQVVEQGAEFESLYKGALIDVEVTQKRLDYLKGLLGRSKSNLEQEISKVSSPLVLQLRKEMADIERNVAVYLSQGVGEGDAQVRREQEKLTAIKQRLTEEIRKLIIEGLPADDPLAQAQELVVQILEVETEVHSFQARAEGLQRVVESYTHKLESLPDKNVQLARLERNRKVDENLYMMMREKHEESRITQAGQIGKVRILDAAVEPVAPISPKVRLNMIIGVILGLGLGLGIAVLREYMDTTIRRVEDVENLGLSVLAAIPRIDSSEIDRTVKEVNERANGNGTTRAEVARLVTHFKPKSPVSEAYRTLRTNLQFSGGDKQIRSFLVTSAGPGEGKSTTTANLGIAISLQGTRTVLIDTDLRRPVIHKIFDLEKNKGLTNVLVGKLTLDEAIQRTNVKNLDIITSGILPPNPAELLGSSRMKALVNELKGRYDLCLFDSPPLIAVTDAAVLSKELDGVLLVVKSGQTQHDALVRGTDLLKNVGTKILGVLLNDVSRENTYGSYYYYYYYHYYYYYGEGGDKNGKKKKRRKRRDEPSRLNGNSVPQNSFETN